MALLSCTPTSLLAPTAVNVPVVSASGRKAAYIANTLGVVKGPEDCLLPKALVDKDTVSDDPGETVLALAKPFG